MDTPTIITPPIVETSRGPCIAGTRITVFSVMDCLKGEWSRDVIKQVMGISDEQLDAMLDYITRHKEAVENEYAAIVRRSETRRAHYEKLFHERSPFFPPAHVARRTSLTPTPEVGPKTSRVAVSPSKLL
jgi:uncharacterized protein (DUF433 family)